jgi:hypothetical protein
MSDESGPTKQKPFPKGIRTRICRIKPANRKSGLKAANLPTIRI